MPVGHKATLEIEDFNTICSVLILVCDYERVHALINGSPPEAQVWILTISNMFVLCRIEHVMFLLEICQGMVLGDG